MFNNQYKIFHNDFIFKGAPLKEFLLTHLTRSEYAQNEIEKIRKENPEQAKIEDARTILELKQERTEGATSYAGAGNDHNIGSEIRSDGIRLNQTQQPDILSKGESREGDKMPGLKTINAINNEVIIKDEGFGKKRNSNAMMVNTVETKDNQLSGMAKDQKMDTDRQLDATENREMSQMKKSSHGAKTISSKSGTASRGNDPKMKTDAKTKVSIKS